MKKSISYLLAGFALVSSVHSAFAADKPSRRSARQQEIYAQEAKGSRGTAKHEGTLHTFETSSGTTLKEGDNGYGAGAEAEANLIRLEVSAEAKSETIRRNGVEVAPGGCFVAGQVAENPSAGLSRERESAIMRTI